MGTGGGIGQDRVKKYQDKGNGLIRGTGMNKRRERKSGCYTHCWCWQGYTRDGRQWEACCTCWKWRDDSRRVQHAPPITYATPESVEVVFSIGGQP